MWEAGSRQNRSREIAAWVCGFLATIVWVSPLSARQLKDALNQLGSDELQVWQRASVELESIGRPAIEDLNQLARSGDLEIQMRAVRVLNRIRENLWSHQLGSFLNGSSDELPGWPAFSYWVGNEAAAREFFVGLLQQFPASMRSLQQPRDQRNHEIREQLNELDFAHLATSKPDDANLPARIVLLFILASDPKTEGYSIHFSPSQQMELRRRLLQLRLLSRIPDGYERQCLAKIFGAWLEVSPSSDPIELGICWEIAQQLHLTAYQDSVCRTVVQSDEVANTVRARAILHLLHAPSSENIKILEPLLANRGIVYARVLDDRRAEIIRVCDVALNALLQLRHEDPARFGMEQIHATESPAEINRMAGFTDETQRRRAIKRYLEEYVDESAGPNGS